MNKIQIESNMVRKSFRAVKKSRGHFKWSFQPLIFFLKFVLGLEVNVDTNKLIRLAFSALSLVIIVSHLAANSPCGLYSSISHNTRDVLIVFESAHNFGKRVSLAFLYLVKDLVASVLFLSTVLVHLAFVANVLVIGKWKKLWHILESIEQSLRLDHKLYRGCRKQCLIALTLLLLVRYILTNMMNGLSDSIKR